MFFFKYIILLICWHHKQIQRRRTISGKITEYVPGDCFKSYRELAEEFFKINIILEDFKVAFLLTSLGTVVYKNLRTFLQPTKPRDCTIDKIFDVLEKYYTPRSHTYAERYKFLNVCQDHGETINEYQVRIKNLAEKCDFGEYIPDDGKISVAELRNRALEDALCDRLLMGIYWEFKCLGNL